MRTSRQSFGKDSGVLLAETLKRYHKSPKVGKTRNYNSIRGLFWLLTSHLKYDILLALFGGKQIESPSLRKEEVMSDMDSSIKPSAVASLLK